MYLPVNMEVQMYLVLIAVLKNISDQQIQMYIQTIADIEVLYFAAHHWSIPNIFLSITYFLHYIFTVFVVNLKTA